MSMIIAVDAMGGDHAPGAIIQGVIGALKEKKEDFSVVLTGPKKTITAELAKYNGANLPIEIFHAEEVVQMDDSPSKVFKAKPNSSMNMAIKLQSGGKAQASLSAGNTGALLMGATFIQGRLPGVQRPSLPIFVPSAKGACLFLDGGANVDCKSQHLLQFAIMGTAYAQLILDIPSPRVALLSIGEESTKGNELVLETYPLLEKSGLNFIGNVESKALLGGMADVIICDGFVGNIVLKLLESIVMMFDANDPRGKEFDPSLYGGVPFLGINGICIKAHGGSSATAIKNALSVAVKIYRQNINQRIEESIRKATDDAQS